MPTRGLPCLWCGPVTIAILDWPELHTISLSHLLSHCPSLLHPPHSNIKCLSEQENVHLRHTSTIPFLFMLRTLTAYCVKPFHPFLTGPCIGTLIFALLFFCISHTITATGAHHSSPHCWNVTGSQAPSASSPLYLPSNMMQSQDRGISLHAFLLHCSC